MLVVRLVVLLTLVVTACGQDSVAQMDEAAVESLYIRSCGGCHGAAGTAQAQTSLESVDQLSRAEIEAVVRYGGEQMPPFERTFTDAEFAAIVAYVTDNF